MIQTDWLKLVKRRRTVKWFRIERELLQLTI